MCIWCMTYQQIKLQTNWGKTYFLGMILITHSFVVNSPPPGTPCVMVTSMDDFSNYFFIPLLILGSWCLFEGEHKQSRFEQSLVTLSNSKPLIKSNPRYFTYFD